MESNYYDAIVVGSGISGGWAAKELTEKGLKVLMLERGRNIDHITGYENAHKEAWDYPHRGERTQEMVKNHPVLSRDFPLNEPTFGMWANEQESPYVEKKRFDWYRGYHVGGRSLLWGRQSYRLNPEDFMANAKEGIAVDWPIRYEDISPWYDYVERYAGISGNRDGLDVLPDGQYQPAILLNCVEKEVAARIKKAYKSSRHLISGRTANMTQPKPEQNRLNCQYRNKCWLGCPFGGYFSTQSCTLPAAVKTGNLTLRPFSIVKEILYDKDKKRATGVSVIDAETHEVYEFKSKIIFVNASTLNSAWLLMNSATDVWEGGLGSSSGELGHNVMDHHFKVGAQAEVEGFDDLYHYGRRPSGFYIPRFRNWGSDKRNYLRGFGYQGSASRQGWGQDVAEMGIGKNLKDTITEPGSWTIGMTAFGEMLPDHSNHVYLNHKKRDKWGLPVLEMNVEIKQNEINMRKDMLQDAVEIFESAGLKNVRGYESDYHPGMGIHEMGTARMGRDPKTSVLNSHNQVWDALNVFLTDGACMTSGSCVNPSLTYMALTARAAHFAVDELKKGNL
ncbi:GMC family oxidoreductase [Colwellia sp. MB02u-18]|uniref:GMC oxidoreductase n=1 Tax=unclassified Colwellia TaxID=196834 RepID=UPI0015F6413E|nr:MULTISPECIES: GMC family oxidoreductase [unclassified Colwellia]MBA6224196.1 GMC family oxidoreductase [Colwellia sp. MB3u-45]MBA6268326.1 GMC family oxidoreductase [Colwellia sp. MB3u-43]MBA6322722.1 GMC family oxidoreductase [Colwellia sp. MB02u-19]MBA6323528.1 GMC family oxidoreductase [Colwellia sp. MB02u-18]MBA6332865.1 GMC family oxidoreductase [Colwellia sp. MB02u-12]